MLSLLDERMSFNSPYKAENGNTLPEMGGASNKDILLASILHKLSTMSTLVMERRRLQVPRYD